MNKPKSPCYIIDGSSYIFRAYFAIRHLSNSKGLPTNAIYGFTQMLLKLLKDEDPECIVMIFDSKEPSFRKEKYPEYKANREVPPEDLVPQFDYIHKVTRALNIPILQKPGFEADDIIATLVKKHLPDQKNAVVVTGDKDLMQLVNDRVSLLDTMKDKSVGKEGVLEKFGVRPDQVVDVLALAGDSSDNIPGVPGIGPKTAGQLIAEYGSLDEVYEHLDEIKGKKRENLEKFKDQAFLSQWLVQLNTEVEIGRTWKDFARKEPDLEACQKLFQELEFQRLLEMFGGQGNKSIDTRHYQLVDDEKKFKKFLGELGKSSRFSFDTETTSLEIAQAQLVGLSFALSEGKAYYLPVGHEAGQKQLDLTTSLKALKSIFENPKIKKMAQHFKYDAGVLANYGVQVAGLECDTLLASYLIDPASSHKLDALSLKYLNHKMLTFEEVVGKNKAKNFSEVSTQMACQYSGEDADVTFRLGNILLKKLKEEKLEDVLFKLEQPLAQVLLKMELAGVKVDITFLKKLQKEFGEKMIHIESNIYKLAGEEFNIQSPKQLAVILFDKLKLPVIKKTKTGYSTDVGVLNTLSAEHDLPREILAFRSLAKLKATYVDALLQIADSKTHRVHTHYNQTIAETGRLSSTEPNLQNIPIRSEDGAKIRQAFIAEPGFILLSADYSQIELRVLAHMSQDPLLLEAFEKEKDIHRLTAASLFDVPKSKVTPEMRASGKTVNFGVIYGQTPYGLSGQLGVSQKEAKQYIEDYFKRYEGVRAFREKVLETARESGEVRTLLGRRRFVHDLGSKNFMARANAERIAFNTIIQGTAADIIKQAMLDIQKALEEGKFKSRMLLQVHDELVFEAQEKELNKLKKLVKKYMEGAVKFRVPLKVDMGQGANWREAH